MARDENQGKTEPERYRAADMKTQEEVGGILERAFQREGGHEPYEEEARRFLALADEAEGKAEAAESLAREAEAAVERYAERHAHTGDPDDLELMQRRETEAQAYRREAESLRLEAERLRRYLP